MKDKFKKRIMNELDLAQPTEKERKIATERICQLIQDLIVDEMTIAHEEGTPTSRLTSLFNKLNE